MNHCYIFDYTTADIYHTKLPDSMSTNEEIENYLSDKLGFQLDCIHYMITESELGIIELKLVKL